jgi:CheY-like chemotaxis protein
VGIDRRLRRSLDEIFGVKARTALIPIRGTASGLIDKWLVRTDGSIRPMSTIPLVTITHAPRGREEASGRLLVVEDDRDAADALAEALAETGYEVTIAGDGHEALEHVHGTGVRPDVVLLDILMPVMDGHAFLATRATDPLLADVPVIVMTGYRAAPSPADVFARLDKPVTLLVLLDAVERALVKAAGSL